MVPAQYHNFRDVFSKEAFDDLPPQKAWDHAIALSPGTELPCSQMFPLSPAEQKELDSFLWENLANGRICPSKSPWEPLCSSSRRRMVCFTSYRTSRS